MYYHQNLSYEDIFKSRITNKKLPDMKNENIKSRQLKFQDEYLLSENLFYMRLREFRFSIQFTYHSQTERITWRSQQLPENHYESLRSSKKPRRNH